ncbi:nucleotidyl transferase AbiEii/AbiGii toxin family protein [Prolixibacter sp. NT017]|uniref:nucleotidyl transferase AbiEii/AbiGii toxin family protein n=1 Tax=Prolixibacter sp. NT017 TaxID=2652390 RepID=UPI001283E1E6|nr:nucleotidyl transferase AbiEii/AbiGii toxin family protein [Prolixibacter sp. NT017]GET25519.1 nucleotidyltransferase [Prolixibacter sp. NT017]
MSTTWYNIPKQTKIRAYTQIAEETGMAPYAVEKDWWVVQTLSTVFSMPVGSYLIFKGGTSLSKAWGLIERFSEDIDLAFDRTYLGFDGGLTRSGVKMLRKKTGQYISDEFIHDLKTRFTENGLTDITLQYIKPEASDADPAQVEIYYPNVIDYPGYIQPRILLEISCSSLKEPNKTQAFDSLLDHHYRGSEFAEVPIQIPTAIPERTFLEKLFLLHEEFHRPHDRIRVERLSRHLYDVYQIIQSEFALEAINNKELYETIVRHRYLHTRIGGINYNLHQPQTLNPVPIPKFMSAWEEDYKTMQEQMIYGDSPAFTAMINEIEDFTKNRINQLPWKMKVKFPEPN